MPLVVFGHMHHMLKGGTKRRNMVHIDDKTGSVLLNCAVVPRLTRNTDGASSSSLHHFTVVSLASAGRYVEQASHVWVAVKGLECQTVKCEDLVQTKSILDGKLTRICLHTTGSSKMPFCPDFDVNDTRLQQVVSNVEGMP